MIEVGFKSDKGLRRSNNEDAFFVIPNENIFMVADGVGGNNSGEVASRMTVSKIVEHIRQNTLNKKFTEIEIKEYFADCIEKVNKSIYNLSTIQPENKGMATTVTIVYVNDGEAYVVNVGDSRVYLHREGSLTQITEDHTYVNALIAKGLISREEAQDHEKKNIITKAIGVEELILPDFFCVSVEDDDVIVLCTDGLHGEIGDAGIIETIATGASMQDTAATLIDRANEHGGRDNITVICLRIREDG